MRTIRAQFITTTIMDTIPLTIILTTEAIIMKTWFTLIAERQANIIDPEDALDQPTDLTLTISMDTIQPTDPP